jgi:cysteine synthase
MPISTQGRGKVYNDVIETVGNTPIVRINKLTQEAGCVATVLAKLEYFNPLSSVKDRAALGMIEAAEREGRLRPGGTLVEPTSGNTGIGLAFIAAVRGYKLVLTLPDNMSFERIMLLKHLGAECVLTPASEGMTGAIDKDRQIVKDTPGALMLQQFKNPANPAAHRTTTAIEIWNDTDGKVDAFVATVGTGGTIQGVGEELRRRNPNIQVIAVQPLSSPVLSGGKPAPHKIQGIGPNFVPDILDIKSLSEIISVSDDEALQTAKDLARKEGLLAGISSGAAVAAALKVAARQAMKGKTIVTLLPDTAERYLSTELFT